MSVGTPYPRAPRSDRQVCKPTAITLESTLHFKVSGRFGRLMHDVVSRQHYGHKNFVKKFGKTLDFTMRIW